MIERVVFWWRRRWDKELQFQLDEAWLAGRTEGDADVEEVTLEKDAFIEQQAAIITGCMAVIESAGAWSHVPDDLYEELRSYV